MCDTQGNSSLHGKGREGSTEKTDKNIQKSANPQRTHNFILEFSDVTSLWNSYYNIASPLHLSYVLSVSIGTFCKLSLREEKENRNDFIEIASAWCLIDMTVLIPLHKCIDKFGHRDWWNLQNYKHLSFI